MVRYLLAAIAALVSQVFMMAPASAQDVNLFPLRVVMDERTRTAEITVFNKAATEGTYRVELIDRFMSVGGSVQPFDEKSPRPSDWRTAEPFLRVFPREVKLKPGESQSIRVAVRLPATVTPGEYRTHLTVTSVPSAEGGESIESAAGRAEGNIVIAIRPIYGISIPLIIRVGGLSSKASIADARIAAIEGGERAMALTLNRSGNASVYGDVEILWRQPNGKEKRIGLSRGVAVYPEVASRPARVLLDPEAIKGLSGGSTIIRYSTDAENKGVVLAEATGPGL